MAKIVRLMASGAEDQFLSPKTKTPCRRLLASLLTRAFLDLELEDTVRNDARKWFFADSIRPFSLNWVLDNLELSESRPVILRSAIEVIRKVHEQQTEGEHGGERICTVNDRLRTFRKADAAVLRQ